MKDSILNRLDESILTILPATSPVGTADLQESGLPEGLVHFLIRTLDRRARLEAERVLRSSGTWFDQDHPDFQALMQETAQRLAALARFPVDEWPRASRQAAETILSFLVEPASTLSRFAFSGESGSMAASDLRRRAGYFSWYPYMGKAVDAWLTRQAQQRVDQTSFEATMVHLDRKLTSDYDADQWMGLLQPLSDLMQFAGIQPAGMPVSMVVRFFEAKDQAVSAAAIASAARQHRADMITLPSLRAVLEASMRPAPSVTPPEAAPPDRAAARPSQPAADPPAEDADLPLWKRFQQRTGQPEGPTGSMPQEPSRPEPLWKSFEQRTDASSGPGANPATSGSTPTRNEYPVHEAPGLESQHVVLGTAVRRRDRFIKDLFGGHEDVYSSVMDELAEAPDWASASALIAERVFRPYRVDIYSDTAVDFTNAVEARYSGTAS